jgi:hypothetical protein
MIGRKVITLWLLCAFLNACTAKPFQPPPPMFKMFERNNVTGENVKDEMLSCGFPNVFTGRKSGDTRADTGRRERCMFQKGFRYIDGYRGICNGEAISDTATSC